jgi:hypothetical protein
VVVELALQNELTCFFIENHYIQKLVFVEIAVADVLSDGLVLGFDAFLEIRVEVDEDEV